MQLYRIAKSQYIGDLSGTGARLYGGRWNEKGVAVIYAAGSRSLAALEFLVHVPLALAPKDLSICRFTIPDNTPITRLKKSALPLDWQAHPPAGGSIELGTRWAAAAKTLLLQVPSVIVPAEFILLINPRHKDFPKVKTRIEPFEFDHRLLNRRG